MRRSAPRARRLRINTAMQYLDRRGSMARRSKFSDRKCTYEKGGETAPWIRAKSAHASLYAGALFL